MTSAMRRSLVVAALALLAARPAAALDPLAEPEADPPSSFTGYWLAARNTAGFAHHVSLAADGEALDWVVYDLAGRQRWAARFMRSALD